MLLVRNRDGIAIERIIPIIFRASGALLLGAFADGGTKGDAVAGRSAFEKRCSGCHALDHDKEGPHLAEIVGRKAGAIADFLFRHKHIIQSSVVWNEAVLDKWLTDPEAVIPNSDMAFRLDNGVERAAIIAYLKETSK
jgi:cytochrome c